MPRTKSPSVSGTRCAGTRRRSAGSAGYCLRRRFQRCHFGSHADALIPTLDWASAVINRSFERVRSCICWPPAGRCDLNIRLQAAVNACESETAAKKQIYSVL